MKTLDRSYSDNSFAKRNFFLRYLFAGLFFFATINSARAVQIYGYTPDGKYLITAKVISNHHVLLVFKDSKTYAVAFAKPIPEFQDISYSKDGHLAAFYDVHSTISYELTIVDLTNFKTLDVGSFPGFFWATDYEIEKDPPGFHHDAMVAFQTEFPGEPRTASNSCWSGYIINNDSTALLTHEREKFSGEGVINNDSFKWEMPVPHDKSFFGEWKKDKKDKWSDWKNNPVEEGMITYVDLDFRKVAVLSLYPEKAMVRVLNGRTGAFIKDFPLPLPTENRNHEKSSYSISPDGNYFYYILPNETFSANCPIHALDLNTGEIKTAFTSDDNLISNIICADGNPQCYYDLGKKLMQLQKWMEAFAYLDTAQQKSNGWLFNYGKEYNLPFAHDYITCIYHIRSYKQDGEEGMLGSHQGWINEYFEKMENNNFIGDTGTNLINAFDFAVFLLDPEVQTNRFLRRPYETTQYNWSYELFKRIEFGNYYAHNRATDTVNMIFYECAIATMLKNYKAASEFYDSYLKDVKNDALAWFNCAVVKQLMNNSTEAEMDFNLAFLLNPALQEIKIHDRPLIKDYLGNYVSMSPCKDPEHEINQLSKIENAWAGEKNNPSYYDADFKTADTHIEDGPAMPSIAEKEPKEGQKKYLYLKTSLWRKLRRVDTEDRGTYTNYHKVYDRSYSVMPYIIFANANLTMDEVKQKVIEQLGPERKEGVPENTTNDDGSDNSSSYTNEFIGNVMYVEQGNWFDCSEGDCNEMIQRSKKEKDGHVVTSDETKEIILN